MKVFLDSNVICRDYWFRSPAYREFLDGLDVVPAELLISQVVLDEVTNRFREDLEAAAQKLVQAQRQLGRLRPESGDTYSPPDSMTESTAYREWLDGRLADVGCEVTPYPDIPHEKVVKRDLSRRKPFSTKGTGYRDFLIWEGLRRKMVILSAESAAAGWRRYWRAPEPRPPAPTGPSPGSTPGSGPSTGPCLPGT